MKNSTSQYTNTPLSPQALLLSQIALGIISVAEKNIEFGKHLYHMISVKEGIFPHRELTTPTPSAHPLLIPNTPESAFERAEWLLNHIELHATAGVAHASQLLSHFKKEFERTQPKDVIFGIVGLAVIGPTLGLIEKKKKNSLSIIIRDNVENNSLQEIQTISQLTLGVFENALTHAHGNTRILEPEISNWFYGEKNQSYYTTTEKTLRELQSALTRSGIPYTTASDNLGITYMAISPIANLSSYTLDTLL